MSPRNAFSAAVDANSRVRISERVTRLREDFLSSTPFVCGERSRLFTEYWKKSGGEPIGGRLRAVLVIANFNNPLGSLIPDEKKKELVELLRRHDVPLIENDVSGEIYFGERRPMTCNAFDTNGSGMLCSSFSKDISPGLRVGWTAAGRHLEEATWLNSTISSSSPTLPQMAVATFLECGGYDQHLRRIRREYARNMRLLSDAVVRYFPSDISLTRPSGGLVLWVRLPEQVDSLELYKMAHGAGITLAPGHVFSPTHQFPNFIRLNAAEFSYDHREGRGEAGRHDRGPGVETRVGPGTPRPLQS